MVLEVTKRWVYCRVNAREKRLNAESLLHCPLLDSVDHVTLPSRVAVIETADVAAELLPHQALLPLIRYLVSTHDGRRSLKGRSDIFATRNGFLLRHNHDPHKLPSSWSYHEIYNVKRLKEIMTNLRQVGLDSLNRFSKCAQFYTRMACFGL